jgi:hypothetical protein
MRKGFTGFLITSAMLWVLSASAWGALVTTSFTGTIDTIDPAYDGALTFSSSVYGSFVYDDALVAASGESAVLLNTNPSFGLTVHLGPYTFTEADDYEAALGYPSANFTNGNLRGLDLIVRAVEDPLWNFVIADKSFHITQETPYLQLLAGKLTFGPAVPVPVPLPAAGGLFAVGLLALFGSRARRTSAA